MTTVVLPTTEIIEEVKQYEPFFDFYPGGIQGVLRDNFYVCAPWATPLEQENIAAEMLHKLWIDYSAHNQEMKVRTTEKQDERMLGIMNEVNATFSEFANATMATIYPRSVFEVNPHWSKWAGNDLIINVDSEWYTHV